MSVVFSEEAWNRLRDISLFRRVGCRRKHKSEKRWIDSIHVIWLDCAVLWRRCVAQRPR